MSGVTQFLEHVAECDPHTAEELLPLVYKELRKLAAQRLSQEKAGQTLQATALVHEAYLRLLGANHEWDDRGHFFAAAAEAMRRILVENARRKQQIKNGGNRHRLELQETDWSVDPPSEDLLALNEALDELAGQDPQTAELVKLRYFAGLTLHEAAEILNIPRRSADRHWAYARTWLYRRVGKSD